MSKIISPEYKSWLTTLKSKIRSVQLKTAIVVNSALIEFYFDLGRMINEKENFWGTHFLENLSVELRAEFPDMEGFSVTNLKYCRRFYKYLLISPRIGDELTLPKRPQAGDEIESLFDQTAFSLITKIPWGHIKLLIDKVKNLDESLFYIKATIENSWSRDTLALQIKTKLYDRTGKAVSNFKHTLPDPFSDLAQQTLKDPYIFDFMTMTQPYKERDIENQLIKHIAKFLLELGKGFAFIGQQYHLSIADNDYYLDLLFYHTRLKCYVVIELKNTKFIPEYAGKLNFYLSAVDTLVKQTDDNPTIGILLCRDKNNIEAEFALRDINKPMGVSEFEITVQLPDNLKSSLPSVEELENELINKEKSNE